MGVTIDQPRQSDFLGTIDFLFTGESLGDLDDFPIADEHIKAMFNVAFGILLERRIDIFEKHVCSRYVRIRYQVDFSVLVEQLLFSPLQMLAANLVKSTMSECSPLPGHLESVRTGGWFERIARTLLVMIVEKGMTTMAEDELADEEGRELWDSILTTAPEEAFREFIIDQLALRSCSTEWEQPISRIAHCCV